MTELRWPWMQLGVLLPLLGALWVRLAVAPGAAKVRTLIASTLGLACVTLAWIDYSLLDVSEAAERWDILGRLIHKPFFVIDELSGPLLPLAALLFVLTNLATMRSKLHTFSFVRCLVLQALILATLSCKLPWGVIALMAAGTLLPYYEIRKIGRPTRVYALHMTAFVVLLVLGQAALGSIDPTSPRAIPGLLMLTAAVLLRSGIVPVHCWLTDLFEHATFGTALLFVTPMVGAYGVTRLVLPVAPHWVLQAISLLSLITAVYAAGMALVQREPRRFFAYLFLSHSSLVLVGIETATPIALTGALSLWLSVGLSLTGFGLSLRCVEARLGRVSLADFSGLYQHVPVLASLFLLTGLASIGFPGTAGFVGLELLVEGAVQVSPLEGAFVVIVTALNGLAVMHAYFRIFTGRPHSSTIDLHTRPAERVSVLVLTALILGGGLVPQPGVHSRYHAAVGLARARFQQGHHVQVPRAHPPVAQPRLAPVHPDHPQSTHHA